MKPVVLDLSHHNTIASSLAPAKAAGVVGIIHKATEGHYCDPKYAARRALAKDAGLMWGAYAFNTGENVADQVDKFFLYAQPDESTLMALDFEDNPRSEMSLAQAREFLRLADARLGRKCWIYSGNRVKDLLGAHVDPFLGSHPLWIAQYGPRAVVQKSWSRYALWQYSEHGTAPGVGGNVDVNWAGDIDLLRKDWVAA